MSLSRTWYTDADVAMSDSTSTATINKSLVWAVKALLKGETAGTHGAAGAAPGSANWTCVGSSDGTTASATDLSDRWTSSYDATKLVPAAAGSSHSWIVLKSPVGFNSASWYLCIDFLALPNWSFVFAKTAFSGGSISARPTSTDEITIASNVAFWENTLGTYRINMSRDANGSFNVFWLRGSTNYIQACFSALSLDSTNGSDLWPVICQGQFASANFGNTNVIANWAVAQKAYNGSNTVTSCLLSAGLFGGGVNLGNLTGTTVGANPLTSKFDAFPIHVYSNTANFGGYRGTLPDWKMTTLGRTYGDVEPSTSVPEHVVMGGFLVPFTVAPTM